MTEFGHPFLRLQDGRLYLGGSRPRLVSVRRVRRVVVAPARFQPQLPHRLPAPVPSRGPKLLPGVARLNGNLNPGNS